MDYNSDQDDPVSILNSAESFTVVSPICQDYIDGSWKSLYQEIETSDDLTVSCSLLLEDCETQPDDTIPIQISSEWPFEITAPVNVQDGYSYKLCIGCANKF